MDKKVIVLSIVIVMIVAAFAGCSEEKTSKPEPKGDIVSGSMDPESGWIQQNGGGNPSSASATLPVSINVTNLKSIEIVVRIEDSNPENSETDEGSDPDDISIYVTSQGVETTPVTGTTPFNTNIKPSLPNATEGEDSSEYFSNEWEIHISAECNGGKNPTGPGGILPIPFLVYIDQGVAYTFEVKYTYEDFGE